MKNILFGAGTYGKLFAEKNSNFVKDSFLFCDNDPDKLDKEVHGLKVISFYEMVELYKIKEIERIIITTAKADQILEQCLLNNINAEIMYYYDVEKNTVKKAGEAYSSTVFSQDGEEMFLKEFFANKKKGFYVAVGAYHPFLFSNTAWAYERGWNGINIEPNLEAYKKFTHIRNHDINLNCGISQKERISSYFEFEEGAYNTFCKENVPNNTKLKKVSKIFTRRLDSIFNEHHVQKIDFMDIDVEGNELDVLCSNNWDLYRPQIILCEQKMRMEDIIKSEIYLFMKQNGYEAVSKYNRTMIYREI